MTADFQRFQKYFGAKNVLVGYLATLARPGRPTLRPVSFFLVGPRLYFGTGAADAKTKQIKKNPRLEVCFPVQRGRWRGYYRVAGTAKIVAAAAARRRIFKKTPYNTEEFWSGPDDPRAAIIEIKPGACRYLAPGKMQEVTVKL